MYVLRANKTVSLSLITLWIACVVIGGMAHSLVHIEDATSRNPHSPSPQACLICQASAQSARSNVAEQARAILRPTFVALFQTHYVAPRASKLRAIPHSIFVRGPPPYWA